MHDKRAKKVRINPVVHQTPIPILKRPKHRDYGPLGPSSVYDDWRADRDRDRDRDRDYERHRHRRSSNRTHHRRDVDYRPDRVPADVDRRFHSFPRDQERNLYSNQTLKNDTNQGRNFVIARGDKLIHKNLTRTYVFHRQPFDWYDTDKTVILEDIEQVFEKVAPDEPDYEATGSYHPYDNNQPDESDYHHSYERQKYNPSPSYDKRAAPPPAAASTAVVANSSLMQQQPQLTPAAASSSYAYQSQYPDQAPVSRSSAVPSRSYQPNNRSTSPTVPVKSTASQSPKIFYDTLYPAIDAAGTPKSQPQPQVQAQPQQQYTPPSYDSNPKSKNISYVTYDNTSFRPIKPDPLEKGNNVNRKANSKSVPSLNVLTAVPEEKLIRKDEPLKSNRYSGELDEDIDRIMKKFDEIGIQDKYAYRIVQ